MFTALAAAVYVTGLVIVILSAFAIAAAVVFSSSFTIESTTSAPGFVVTTAEVLTSEALFAWVIFPIVIRLISVSGHCFPP
jgi:hypothetical protein